MATHYATQAINQAHKKGLIQEGYKGNLVAFDCNFNITCVIFNGEVIL